ncbi:nitrogenase iron-molybdenum cofactor biosynthesis protein NifN [Pseudothauera nasutitermitis]|uniref:Nitrogenase iron-molybdenum cofactor biosynthesis protein NifN n=1 Tax=Pseudothauera nasutitermitis TaxID=2565930 RepID=A0A4S4ASM8_9RHOO|nr:nitrogenase iron-molybdenum cofactor biosynthesis protein NifN [Pseudothauera nasutitermitis]THF62873.1 nitrogenase iron-molybdenum cofactor biosynthesis protein NifN [Pseudothauera nasutitermitis]
MAEIVRHPKALSVNPLKSSAPAGAALACLGINRGMPLLHGSQGCTAFAKVFFVRHFREPIPLQTTAMDQVATVMSADDNVVQALATVCGKAKPGLVVLATTALSETQGTDIARLLREFRAQHPAFAHIPVAAVNTPDFNGCLESGYAAALRGILDVSVPHTRHAGKRRKQVNLLLGSHLTPGDVETIKDWVEAFGLRPVAVPDLADALDGHLIAEDFLPVTLGGTPAGELATLGEAAATIVVGRSLAPAADLLRERTGVPDWRFDGLMGLEACDRFTALLAELSGHKVPDKLERQRAQLQDAMVDTHFMTGLRRIGVAADPDLLHQLCCWLAGMGSEIVAAVSPARAAVLDDVPAAQVHVGDLEDLEDLARAGGAELLLGNSHVLASAGRLGVPLLRAGIPQYDLIGGHAKTWVGYRGTRQALFDLANLVVHNHEHITPYRARLVVRTDRDATQPQAAAGGRH